MQFLRAKYIIRLDDACPTMRWDIWKKLENLFDEFNITPIVGVIPDCKDPKLVYVKNYTEDAFWQWVKSLEMKGWYIAMHGYQHFYETEESGLIGLNNYSEFAGLPYEVQAEKIKKGYQIFLQKGIKPLLWMAPAHSFDLNTLKALKYYTDIEYITDGFSIFPFTKFGFKWIPQQLWRFRKFPFGVWTICLHPNVMSLNDLDSLKDVLAYYRPLFLDDILNNLNFSNNIIKDTINFFFHKIYSLIIGLKD